MNLEELNTMDAAAASEAFAKCCGASEWVKRMVAARPFHNKEDLFRKASDAWSASSESDWIEAFTHHPKIGDIESLAKKFASTKDWAGNEQGGMSTATMDVIERLVKGNKDYEEKFGFIFIVCATGKSAGEMLGLLEERLPNDRSTELKNAAAEQEKITHIRLEKLLA